MCDLILPFDLGEPRCLQALVRSFTLTRVGKGSVLDLSIEDDVEVVWNDIGKACVRKRMSGFPAKSKVYQKDLDDYIISERGKSYSFPPKDRNEKHFCFRYGSAGTLPIINWRGHDHYCLFYREVFPIGWNIANGGFDSRLEMTYPLLAVERELREELIIADPAPSQRLRYKFTWDAGRPVDRPEFGTAHILWARALSRLGYHGFGEKDIELKWDHGPDLLVLRIGDERPEPTTGCFLNINAEDFGIEVDRIARLTIPDSAILMDGELFKQKLINAPVGLFRTDRMHTLLDRPQWRIPRDFAPDAFFFTGELHEHGQQVEDTVSQEYIPHLTDKLSAEALKAWHRAPCKYDLCPATRRIIKRAMKRVPTTHESPRYDVFISYRHCMPDETMACDLRETLVAAGFRVARDIEDFDPPALFLTEMERCVRESRYTVAIVTPQYLQGGACLEEAIICKVLDMKERTHRFIPLFYQDTPLPAYILAATGIDLRQAKSRAKAMEKLIRSLRRK